MTRPDRTGPDRTGQIVQKNVFTGNIQSNLTLQYDDTGNLESLGTGVFDSYYFYSNYGYTNDRLTRVQTNGLQTVSVSDTDNAAYEYDPDGKLKKITYPRLNDNSLLTTEYAYNALGRLTSITNKKDSTVLSWFAYTYDLRGNRRTKSSDRFELDLVSTGYYYNLSDMLETVTKGTESIADMLGAVMGPALSFNPEEETAGMESNADESGTEAEAGTVTVTGPAIAATQGTETTTMEYYADGLRAGKYTATSSDLYVYDLSDRLVAEAQNSPLITANYVWGPDRVLVKKESGGGEYYYLYNGHGDVIQIVDRNGNVVNNYRYDEWGNILESNETISNPFKYAGEVYDEETGLYYLGARYYDPALGRFLNEDSFEGQVNNPLSLNLYTYCYNNPLAYIDPTGNTARDFLTGLANALDDNLTGGTINWLVNKIMDVDHDYRYESGVDYYTGRVIGDALSMIGGSGAIIKGVGKIVASVTGGGAISIGSGGTLAIGGIAIAVGGAAAGVAEVTYGGVVFASSIKNFSNDVNKLNEFNNKGAGSKTKTNLGKEIDITPSSNHSTTTKNPGLNGKANSSIDILDSNGNIKTRRWYGPDGKQIRDVDFTNHGNPKVHPEWPHEHGPR